MKSKIDYDEIIKLIDLLETRNLYHIELEVEGFKIKISREPRRSGLSEQKIVSIPPEDLTIAKTFASPESELHPNQTGLHIVTSPMVGTFYRASDPSAPPFVEKGDHVKKNQTLCIIEAMKLMNEIEADVEGTLEEVFIKNGKPVEYGQKLFAIKVLA